MSTQPLSGARVSCWPVIYDIEHGVQHGTDLILPNGTTVQTEKEAPETGDAYAIQHPGSVAVPMSADLLAKGYTSTQYDLVSGDTPTFLGWSGQYGTSYWFYLAEDGVLCGIDIKTDGTITSTPIPRFVRVVSGFETALVHTPVARSASVATDMSTRPPRWIIDVQNNGAEAILSGDSEGGVQYTMGYLFAIYHVKLSGPSTAVVMAADSKTLCYNRFNLSAPDNWLHTGETVALEYCADSTESSKGVIGGTQTFWRDRIASARFKADGSVEVIHLYSTESMSTSGVYNRVLGYPGSAYSALVGNAQMTSTIVYELRGYDAAHESFTIIDSFAVNKTSSSTTEWILDGEVIYTSTHTITTHSGLGLLSDCVVTASQAKDGAWMASAGYSGSDQAGDASGYAYVQIDRAPVGVGEYRVYYYVGVQRLTNKVYTLNFNGEFSASVFGYYRKFARWVHGVYGINGAKHEATDGLVNYIVPVPTRAEFEAGGFAYYVDQLNATQHPVTFELRYFGAAVSAAAYCFV